MNGEFTQYCKQFYELFLQLDEQELRFENLVANAIPYKKQTKVSQLDAILACNLKIQQARGAADETKAALRQLEKTIMLIMEYFEIPHGRKLTCELPGVAELRLYTKENGHLYLFKTKDLAPLEEDGSIITIEMNYSRYVRNEEDED